MNGVYIREMPPAEFIAQTKRLLGEAGVVDAFAENHDDAWFSELAPLVAERAKRLTEIVPMVRYLFEADVEIDERSREKVLAKEGAAQALEASRAALADVTPFESDAIEEALRRVPEATGLKPKLVFQSVRVAVTGSMVSPPLFESLELLGKGVALDRIDAALAAVEA
jgi:glutamyl-tRNA synthetase